MSGHQHWVLVSDLFQLNPGFAKENMTQIAHHETTYGCLLKPTSGQPKVTTGTMLSEKACGRTNCHHHLRKRERKGTDSECNMCEKWLVKAV